ncbi:MAG TPA: hypothetical protein VHF47_10030 [Acidimicrobiales bacterium]|nr:hypothetical protein [Acidimicrobiales bacterium]
MRRFAALLAALAVGLLAPGEPARATENGEFSLQPVRPVDTPQRERSYVVRTVAPGIGFDDRLEARNLTDAPLDLVVEPVDAVVTADGSFAPGTTTTAEGGWLRVTPERLRVPARGSVRVALRVDVPADAAPGDHIAAVVVRKAETPSGPGVHVVNRVGVRVYLTVTPPAAPTPRRAFEFRALRWTGERTFAADVANVGDLLVEPLGTLTIARGDFATTVEVPVLGTVPPGAVTTLPVRSDGSLERGTYEARLRLQLVQGGEAQEQRVTFTVAGAASTDEEDDGLPWLPVLVAVAALALVVGFAVRRRI